MTKSRLRAALLAYGVLAALAIPLDARITGTDFEVRHVVWVAMGGFALKSYLAWLKESA
jgi:hypothetical protein